MRSVCLFILASGSIWGQFKTKLSPDTEQAFEEYRVAAEREFKWTARFVDPKAGAVTIAPANQKGVIDVKDGMIHDWAAATFVPNVTVDDVVRAKQDYANYKNVYPEVIESQLLSHEGNRWRPYLKLVKKKTITVTLASVYEVEFKALEGGSWAAISRSTKMAEIDDGKELPAGTGHGFLWRLNAYWLIQPRPGGVYLECRTLSLTRDIPTGLGWVVRPFVSGLPRESLQSTLLALARTASTH